MNKKEFLDILYEQLSGQMPEGNVAAHVQYYRNYIEEEQRKGRSEDDILNELGDPHLIARTLLDTEAAAILIAAIVIVLLCTVLSVLIPVMVIFGIVCFIISKLRN